MLRLTCQNCKVAFHVEYDETIFMINFNHKEIDVLVVTQEPLETILFYNKKELIRFNQLLWIFPSTIHQWAGKYIALKAFS